ncbi:unnamed protein product [Ascophyllum nodosum]
MTNVDIGAVIAAQDGGPEWEGRNKAFFDNRRGNKTWFRRWAPKAGNKAIAMLFIVHGLHSHGGRWAQVAHYYTAKDYLVFAHDHLGHGLTAQADEGTSGVVDDFTKMTDDFTEFVEKMVDDQEDKTLPVLILGHSMGSAVATLATKNCLENPALRTRIKKLVLTGCPLVPGPAAASPLGMRFLFPLTKNTGLMRGAAWMLASVSPKGYAAPIEKAALSKDPEVEMEAAVDPLMVKGSIRNITAYEIIRMMQAVRDNAHKITVPTLIMHGADDQIAYLSGSEQLRDMLTGCEDVRMEVYPGVLHEVLRHREHFDGAMAVLDQHWTKFSAP